MYTDYDLPKWLKELLDNLRIRGCNDHNKVKNNLYNSPMDNLNYLVTYFPRTYTEIKTIMDELSEETDYFERQDIRSKSSFRILSVGCGTGGDVVSMIDSIREKTGCQDFFVTLIDGNKDALEKCQKIISRQETEEGLKIQKEVKNAIVTEPSDFQLIAGEICSKKFDFIVTSKFINELIGKFDNFYSRFVTSFSALLDTTGLIIITDTTDQRAIGENLEWIPKLMNSDFNDNISADIDIGTIMPPPCNCQRWRDNRFSDSQNESKETYFCRRCYTSFKNKYSHIDDSHDPRITFRIFARKIIQERIQYKSIPNTYVVTNKKDGFLGSCKILNS